jgi:HEAT repeat protein
MCRGCGFTTTAHRFDKIEGIDKGKVRTALEELKTDSLFLRIDRAIAVEQNWTNDPVLLAHLGLAAKWLADDTGETEIINRRLSSAIKSHEIALNSVESNDRKASYLYLIGELYRQLGDGEQAVKWFLKARKLAKDELADMVEQQMALARIDADKKSQPDLAAIRKRSDAGKLIAIKHLREINREDVIEFLKEYCLQCPERLREQAIRILVEQGPKPYHLPIFLEGLKNDHFRTVQGCAMAVEMLGATEAAPIIVELLKNPVEWTEYRLLAALGAVATENELEFLASQLERRTNQNEILRALLNTRSNKAIPYIIKLLEEDRLLGVYYGRLGGISRGRERHRLEKAVAFGSTLLDQLPHLDSNSIADGPTLFKINVLSVSDGPDIDKQLISALSAENDVAFQAGLALARRGNHVGKDVLIQNIERLRSLDENSITYLYPLLKEGDFDSLFKRMLEQKVERKEFLKEWRAQLVVELNDPNINERERARLERELGRSEFDEESFIHNWVLLLAATGNEKARPICLKLMESAKAYVRARAVKALVYIWSAETGDKLAALLPEEEPLVRSEIVRALGHANDKRHAKTLIWLLREPTLIETKIAWIEAMSKLAPADALNTIDKWSKSPNQTLAAVASKAANEIRHTKHKKS